MGVATGGFAYGLLEKTFPNLPTVPLLGKAGTVAAACYFLKPTSGIIQDIGVAAAAIAGYQLGEEGKVHGGYHGLAAEV